MLIMHLQDKIYEECHEIPNAVNKIVLKGIDTEFGGYGVFIELYRGDTLICQCHTAFDVVADCTKAIRYGFLSDFHTVDGLNCEDVSNLRKLHINMVQYYDWSYRHDKLVSDKAVYKDMMGREVDLDTIRRKIDACRTYGMKSIGYGAVYAASGNYYNKHKENAFYTSAGDPFVFINIFYIMNIARDSRWRSHIIEEYARAVSEVGFDGIHMDTYGFPKTAYSYEKKLIRLDEEYPSLIQDTKDRLDKITMDNHLIFNNVGNWPVGSVARAPQDAVYIEVWEPYVSYNHIKQMIEEAKLACGKEQKPIILAAYLAPFRLDTEVRAANAAYLLTAAIVTSGATHLLLGENNAVLTQGYYVDHSFMSDSVSKKMRCYYDFIVQYMELFYDTELKDVSMTHLGWDNMEYHCLYDSWSVDGQSDKVWLTIREKENRKLISLINLCGNDNEWNRGKETPPKINKLGLQVQIDKPIRGIYYASPDYCDGRAKEIDYSTISTDRGYVVQFEVPDLDIWCTVWIDF